MKPARLGVMRMVYPEMVSPIEWAKGVLRTANLNDSDKYRLGIVAQTIANEGGKRGNISDAWKRLGVTTEHINDLYV